MTSVLTKRRVFFGGVILVLTLLTVGLAARLYLVGRAVGSALREAGATEIRYQVSQASLWRIVVEDVGFLLRLQPFSAQRITLDRAHWWSPSLGTLRVEGARVPVKLAELTKPTPPAVPASPPPPGPASLPFAEISLDGQLVIQADGQADQALTVTLAARPQETGVWTATTQVTAPGLEMKGEGRYNLRNGDIDFTIPALSLDLKPWQGFLQQWVPAPAGDWQLEGRFTGEATGRWSGDKLSGQGRVQLRAGRAASVAKAITAEGIEADLEFTDLAAFTTKLGTLRLREVRTGQLTLRDLHWEFAFAGLDRIAVTKASLQALGGTLAAEPFGLVPSRNELDAVVTADGISVEEVMALTKDLPAKATGRVNGRFPLHVDATGFRLGTGWLELKPGVQAEIELHAAGLLTGGASPGSPSYAVLQKVESGLLKLRVSELRLDIRPPNAPPGRSAQLHFKGAPVDPEVKAPVILDLNVNGPLERLISMGMDSRLSVGSGK